MGRRAKLGRFFIAPDDFAVLDTLTARLCRVLGAPACCLMFYDAVDEHLVVVATQGMPTEKGEVLKEKGPISHWLNETTTPLAVNDVEVSQVDPSFVLLPEAKSMLWVPIFVAAHICGALAVFHVQKNAFFGSDMDILDFISSQVASIIELYMRMDEVTVTDFLTGLMSRPYFLERLKEESFRSERYGPPVSFVNVSLKPSDPGDTGLQRRILPEAAQRLKQAVRGSDIVARSGDWSFSIILPETGSGGAEVVVGKFQSEIRRLVGERIGEGSDFGVEVKFVCFPETEPDREQFLAVLSSN